MDPRDRADAALARASARNRWAVTPDNATSPMDAKPTVQIPRVVVNAADPREQDPDTTITLPSAVAAGKVPVPPQQQGQVHQSQPLPHVQQTQQVPAAQQSQPLPTVQQSQPLPYVQQSQPLPHVQQSQPLPHVQQSQPLPHVQPTQQLHPQQGQQQQGQRPDSEQPTKQLPGIIPTTPQNQGRRMSLTDRLSGALPETDQP
ncbi:hypothetical protein [Kutzneria sp. NPDC051319]|uniref:hypothetical protein n=1 Tax=Kutzneria sp. NPDC051319 TaxID=3155047 RepID=UPI00341E3A79